MKTKSTCLQLTPGLVVNNGGDKKCNSILVACHPDPVFEVNPFLAQGAAKEVYKKMFEMLRGVVHMALVARPWEQPVAGHQD